MKRLIVLICFLAITTIYISCERSPDEKRKKIEENTLKNSAYKKEIRADSLKKKANELYDQAKKQEKEADILRDSERRM